MFFNFHLLIRLRLPYNPNVYLPFNVFVPDEAHVLRNGGVGVGHHLVQLEVTHVLQ